ncbi:MAG TPA: pyridoxal-dependent decarboxylase, partial [Pyrinomonadaceae bacterium]|nr:pyridoxal-dependent decarboxylase [Pyrinomonadaceae bacterium]
MAGNIRSGSAEQVYGDMPKEEFRRFGHQLIDWISDYFEHIESRPVLAQIEPGDLKAQLPPSPPNHGEPMEAIIADLDRLIMPALTHWNHPAFFAYFATSTSAPGIFGELLCAAFDNKAMLWRTSPASTELEEVTVDWLRQMMGLDKGLTGIIYDTASISSMHAIAAARQGIEQRIREEGMSGRTDLPLLRVYASEQAHSSIDKGMITLGLGQRALRKIPTDKAFRLDPEALALAVQEDKSNGIIPFCVVATVGTTSTSSIDPVRAIVEVCEKHSLWLHVDAAYAGSAAVVSELRYILDGCERADSLTVNPHKWLFTPFDLSVLYCRHMDLLRRAFSLVPEYLRTPEQEKVRSGSDYGVQLGRRFRALKLWMIIRYFGHEGLAARIREHCRLAQLFSSWVKESIDWELMAPVPLGLVCFRACPEIEASDEAGRNARLDVLNEAIMHGVNASGRALLSHTRLNGKITLRLSIGNIRTTEKHVRQVWEVLNQQLELLS